MNPILNRISMFTVQKPNTPDRRKMSNNQNTFGSNNKMSLVALRNKQLSGIVDTVFFHK